MIHDSKEILEKLYFDVVSEMKQYGETEEEFASSVKLMSDENLIKYQALTKKASTFYKVLQMVVKQNANGIYGGLGSSFFKYTDIRIAADITAEARGATNELDRQIDVFFDIIWPTLTDFHLELKNKYPEANIKLPVKKIDVSNRMCIYADTDSLFVEFVEVLKSLSINTNKTPTKTISDIIEYISAKPLFEWNAKCLDSFAKKRNLQNNHIFEHEVTSRTGIFLEKKKYVCSYLWKDGSYIADEHEFKATGIELSQNAYSDYSKTAIKHFVDYILSPVDYDLNVYIKMAYAYKMKMHKLDYTDRCLRKSVKFLEYAKFDEETGKYKYIPEKQSMPQVKGAIRYNNLILENNLSEKYPLVKGTGKSMIIMYYDKYDKPFSYPIDMDFPHEIAPEPDVEIMAERTIFSPVKRLLECVFPNDNLLVIGKNSIKKRRSMM